jgi:hypothetical protein
MSAADGNTAVIAYFNPDKSIAFVFCKESKMCDFRIALVALDEVISLPHFR